MQLTSSPPCFKMHSVTYDHCVAFALMPHVSNAYLYRAHWTYMMYNQVDDLMQVSPRLSDAPLEWLKSHTQPLSTAELVAA
jgi:hypothetical protein